MPESKLLSECFEDWKNRLQKTDDQLARFLGVSLDTLKTLASERVTFETEPPGSVLEFRTPKASNIHDIADRHHLNDWLRLVDVVEGWWHGRRPE